MNFEKVKYIKNLIPVEKCKELTNSLKESISKGETFRDDQCPLSESIYGPPYFEQLLLDVKPRIESTISRKLNPTYSYGRIYKKNDSLEKHTDRSCCEINATIALGWEGSRWPFYVEIDKETIFEIFMEPGDAVIYYGSVPHWREKFEGEWQSQVFLHYVDANGPNASKIYDGRKSLNII